MSIQLNPSEISDLIKERIKNFESNAEAKTEGTIVMLTDGIARVHGLSQAMQGEMLEFPWRYLTVWRSTWSKIPLVR